MIVDAESVPQQQNGTTKGGERQFKSLDEGSVAGYISSHPPLAAKLGGTPQDWSVKEVGDGNINFVYVVVGPHGSLVVKQALPYIRCVGESWPMSVERANFEAQVLQVEFKLAPEHVPEVLLHDPVMALIAEEYLAPPHIVLRKGLVKGLPYPHLADHISTFLARTLFGTSLLTNTTAQFRPEVAKYCGNVEMCRLTEAVIFTEPYFDVPHNRWTSPQLDEDVKALRGDTQLKVEIAQLKQKFCESAQALLHADLHTGSIMAHPESTKVIDPEFGFYGPMGFDVGAFLGNLLLAYFSQDGHSTVEHPRDSYKAWILETLEKTWELFDAKFRALWTESTEAAWKGETSEFPAGDAFSPSVFNSPEALKAAQDAYMGELLADSLGFAGAKMIRRLVGIAHVEDMDSIADPDVRGRCERKALNCGKALVKQRFALKSISDVLALVKS